MHIFVWSLFFFWCTWFASFLDFSIYSISCWMSFNLTVDPNLISLSSTLTFRFSLWLRYLRLPLFTWLPAYSFSSNSLLFLLAYRLFSILFKFKLVFQNIRASTPRFGHFLARSVISGRPVKLISWAFSISIRFSSFFLRVSSAWRSYVWKKD